MSAKSQRAAPKFDLRRPGIPRRARAILKANPRMSFDAALCQAKRKLTEKIRVVEDADGFLMSSSGSSLALYEGISPNFEGIQSSTPTAKVSAMSSNWIKE